EGLPLSVRHFGISDWERAALLPELDIFGCDPYWFIFGAAPEAFVETFTLKALRASRRAGDLTRRPRQTQVWVQGFDVPAGREQELYGAVRLAARLGGSHAAVGGCRGLAGM